MPCNGVQAKFFFSASDVYWILQLCFSEKASKTLPCMGFVPLPPQMCFKIRTYPDLPDPFEPKTIVNDSSLNSRGTRGDNALTPTSSEIEFKRRDLWVSAPLNDPSSSGIGSSSGHSS